MPAKKTRPAPKAAPAPKRPTVQRQPPTERDIAMRAYQLFIQRGGEHGRDIEDWLLAQRELSPNP
ncbi:MAG TPA: DUF2934 domain-containing protein [Vicinamibacterales bacterium]|nr:DUF2934 domain-containing protein [Vicinamibacterales bacterium]